MSDEICVQVVCGEEFSPIARWRHGGVSAPFWLHDFIADWETRNAADRKDVSSVFKDLFWPDHVPSRIYNATGVMTEADSPGDAGAVVIDVSGDTMKFTVHAGYLRVTPKGLVDSREEA